MGFFESYKKKTEASTPASFKSETPKEQKTKVTKYLGTSSVAKKEIKKIESDVKKKKRRSSGGSSRSSKPSPIEQLKQEAEKKKAETPASFEQETAKQRQAKALKYNVPIKRVSDLQMKLNRAEAKTNRNIKKIVQTKQFQKTADLTLKGRDKVVNVLNKYQDYLRTSNLNEMTKAEINSTRRQFLNNLEKEQKAKLDKGVKEGFLIGSAQILRDPLKYKADEDVQDVVDILTKPKETVEGTWEVIKDNPAQYIGEVGAEYAIFGTVEEGVSKLAKKGKKFWDGASKEFKKKFFKGGGKKVLQKLGGKFIPIFGQVSTGKDIYDVLKAGYLATIPIKKGESKKDYNARIDKKVENDLKVEASKLKKEIKGDKNTIKELQKEFKEKQKKEKEFREKDKKKIEADKKKKEEEAKKKEEEAKKIKKDKQNIAKKKTELKKLDEKIKKAKTSKSKKKYKKLKELKKAQIKKIESKIEVKKKEKQKQKVEVKQKGKKKISKLKQKLKEKKKKKQEIKQKLKEKKKEKQKQKQKEKQKAKEKKKEKQKQKKKEKLKLKFKTKKKVVPKKKPKVTLTLDKMTPKKSVSVLKAKTKAEKYLLKTKGKQNAKITSTEKIEKVTKKKPNIKYKLSKSGKILKLSETNKKKSSKSVSKVSKVKKIKKSSKNPSKTIKAKKTIKKAKRPVKKVVKKAKTIKRVKKNKK